MREVELMCYNMVVWEQVLQYICVVEQALHCALVNTEGGAGAHGVVHAVDGIHHVRRPQVDGGEACEGVEAGVDVAHDERAFVAHDAARDGVEKQRHSELQRRREQHAGAIACSAPGGELRDFCEARRLNVTLFH